MRQLLVCGVKTFKITIPDDAKITFGPWAPPRQKMAEGWADRSGERGGTLRIYQGSKDNIIACFAHVDSFRDLSMGYAEEVATEEGATIWKDDEKGYVKENKLKVKREWVEHQLPAPKKK